jgi:Tfp pilus assembly protein PilO
MTPRSQNAKLWLGLGAAIALLMVVPTYLLVISPHRASTQTLKADTESVVVQNAALQAKTAELRKKAENRDELTATLSTALAELPWETKLPEFSRQLSKHAAKRGVTLTSIAIGAATTPGQPAAAAVDPTTTVRAVPITIVSTGTALQQLFFLRDVQQIGPRRALVTATSMLPTEAGTIEDEATMTTQLTVFSSPVAPETRAQLRDILGENSAS